MMELLRRGEVEAAAEVAARRGGSRLLVARLWDADAAVRSGAVSALGLVAVRDAGRARELARRFMWALNDESGTHGAAVLPALAAVAASEPAAVIAHLGALIELMDDDGLRPGIVAVLAALAERAPGSLQDFDETLRTWQERVAGEERAGLERVVAMLGGQ